MKAKSRMALMSLLMSSTNLLLLIGSGGDGSSCIVIVSADSGRIEAGVGRGGDRSELLSLNSSSRGLADGKQRFGHIGVSLSPLSIWPYQPKKNQHKLSVMMSKTKEAWTPTTQAIPTRQLQLDSFELVDSISRGGGSGSGGSSVLQSSQSQPNTALLICIVLMLLQGYASISNPARNLQSFLLPPNYSDDAYNNFFDIVENPLNVCYWKLFGITTISLATFAISLFFIMPYDNHIIKNNINGNDVASSTMPINIAFALSTLPWLIFVNASDITVTTTPSLRDDDNGNNNEDKNLMSMFLSSSNLYLLTNLSLVFSVGQIFFEGCRTMLNIKNQSIDWIILNIWKVTKIVYYVNSTLYLFVGIIYWVNPYLMLANTSSSIRRNTNDDDDHNSNTSTLIRRFGSSLLLYGLFSIMILLFTSSSATSLSSTTAVSPSPPLLHALGYTLIVGVIIVGKTHLLNAPQFKTQSKLFSPIMFATMALIIFTDK